jgi:hypothetical protein
MCVLTLLNQLPRSCHLVLVPQFSLNDLRSVTTLQLQKVMEGGKILMGASYIKEHVLISVMGRSRGGRSFKLIEFRIVVLMSDPTYGSTSKYSSLLSSLQTYFD